MFLVGTGLLVQRNVYFFLHHSQRHSENKPKGLKVLKQADQLNSHNIVDCCSKENLINSNEEKIQLSLP